MYVDNKFEIGSFVYLSTDPDQFKRIVVCIKVNKYDLIYILQFCSTYSEHYDFEITNEPDQNILLGIQETKNV